MHFMDLGWWYGMDFWNFVDFIDFGRSKQYVCLFDVFVDVVVFFFYIL